MNDDDDMNMFEEVRSIRNLERETAGGHNSRAQTKAETDAKLAFKIDGWGMASSAPQLIIQGAGQEKSRVIGSIQVPRNEWLPVSRDEQRLTPEAARSVRVVDYQRVTGLRVDSTSLAEPFA